MLGRVFVLQPRMAQPVLKPAGYGGVWEGGVGWAERVNSVLPV